MKMILNLFLVILLWTPLSAQNNNVTSKINRLLKNSFFDGCNIAIDVHDLTSNKSVYHKNEKLLLHPASNVKLFTSCAALLYLGPNYNFNTSFYYSGEIKDSVCYGDIYVVGGFDPDFTTSDLDSMMQIINESGISKIQGNLYGDVSVMDTIHWGKGWMWDDDPRLFAAHLSPLSINKNGVKIAYEPSGIAFPAKINAIPESDYYSINNSSCTVLDDTSTFFIKRDYVNHKNDIIIGGHLSFRARPDTAELNLSNPAQYFLAMMKERMNSNGIIITGITDTATLPQDARLITSYERPLLKVLKRMNKKSDNLNAELTLRAIALERLGKPASAKNGLKMIDSLLTDIGLQSNKYRLVDGSGLSFYNLVSAESLNALLTYMYNNHKNLFNILYDTLPIAGVDGGLKPRMASGYTYNNVHAKTGTLSGISTLSGYLTTKDKHLLSFSILIQNYTGKAYKARRFQDEICKILCGIKNAKP